MTTQLYKSDTKNIIIIIGDFREGTLQEITAYNKENKTNLELVVLADRYRMKRLESLKKRQENDAFEIVSVNFKSSVRIKKALEPLKERVFSLTTQYESFIDEYKKVIPHLPFLPAPTLTSLDWASDKVLMREMLEAQNPSLVPHFYVVKDATIDTLEKIQKKVGYPVIVKPAGLAGSRLVSICYHEEELQHVLRKTFRKLTKLYKEQNGRGTPQILIEQAIEGVMYSVDGYIDSVGKVYTCPPVHIKTGKEIGFDDFFGYRQMTPTQLNDTNAADARQTSIAAVRSLCPVSTTYSAALFSNDNGW